MRYFVLISLSILISCLGASAPQARSVNISSPRGYRITRLERDSTGALLLLTKPSGVWASSDTGRTWSDLSAGLPDTSMRSLTVLSDGGLIVAAAKGLYAYDGGRERWRHLDAPDSSYRQLVALSGNRVVALDDSARLYFSEDGGVHWVRRFADIPVPRRRIGGLVSGPGGVLYADGASNAIYRSSDAGLHWEVIPTPIDSGIVGDVAVGDEGELYVSEWRKGIYVRRTDAAEWERVPWGLKDVAALSRVRGVGFFASTGWPERLWFIPDGGLPRETSVHGLEGPEVLTLPDGTILLNGHSALIATRDRGRTWRQFSSFTAWDINGTRGDAPVTVDARGRLVACTFGGAFRSTDHGDSWELLRTQLGEVAAVVSLGGDTLAMFDPEDGCQISTDDGGTWSELSADSIGRVLFSIVRDRSGRYLAVTYPRSALGILGQTVPSYERRGALQLHRSGDGGRTWQQVGTATTDIVGLRWVGGRLCGVVQTPEGHRGVLLSADDGENWTDLFAGSDIGAVVALEGDTLVAAGHDGAWMHVRGDTEVREINEGLRRGWDAGLVRVPGRGAVYSAAGWDLLPRGATTWVPLRGLALHPRVLAADDTFLYVSVHEPEVGEGRYIENVVQRVSIADQLRGVKPAPPEPLWWEELPALSGEQIKAFHATRGGGLLALENYHVVRLLPGANSWEAVALPTVMPGWVCDIAVAPGTDRIIAGMFVGSIAASSDGGSTWSLEWHPNPSAFAKTGVTRRGELFVCDGLGIQSRMPGDTVWRNLAQLDRYNDVTFLLPQEDGGLYLGLLHDGLARLEKDRKTMTWLNDGLWDPASRSGLAGPTTVDAFVVAPTGDLYAAHDGGVYRSTDRGKRWKRVSTDCWAYALVTTKRGDLFAATGSGVLQSTDGGKSWRKRDGGLARIGSRYLVLGTDDRLYLMTSDRRVYRSIRPVR